jgi:hypothetical protein
MKSLLLPFTCLTLLVLAGCEHPLDAPSSKDSAFLNNSGNAIEAGSTALDQHIQRTAKSLAILLTENREVKDLLQIEANRRVDGDYDVIYSSFSYLQLGDGRTIKQSIDEISSRDFEPPLPQLNPTEKDNLRRLIVSIPIGIENWSEKAPPMKPPLVAVLPSDFEETTVSVTAYDQNGQASSISTEEEPTGLVAVVSIGERIAEDGLVKEEYRPGTETVVEERVIGHGEFLQGVRCDDLNAIPNSVYM